MDQTDDRFDQILTAIEAIRQDVAVNNGRLTVAVVGIVFRIAASL
ncbi:MAG: hypothetical protein NW237_06805 [Cyanobacteriota bacterium]|nr:hypothetical protein [Cyanobacteriota bacterium]